MPGRVARLLGVRGIQGKRHWLTLTLVLKQSRRRSRSTHASRTRTATAERSLAPGSSPLRWFASPTRQRGRAGTRVSLASLGCAVSWRRELEFSRAEIAREGEPSCAWPTCPSATRARERSGGRRPLLRGSTPPPIAGEGFDADATRDFPLRSGTVQLLPKRADGVYANRNSPSRATTVSGISWPPSNGKKLTS
jgi:hypothetical protein